MTKVKKVNVTFDFDVETEAVSNVKCMVDEVSAVAKRAPAAKKPKKEDNEVDPIVRLESNKVVLNGKSVESLQAEYGCRVIIKYEVFDKQRIPVIGTDSAWGEEGNGNKITKTNTVSYRGNANTILNEYGTEFKLEPWRDGIYKLIPLSGIPESVGIVIDKPKATPKKKTTPKKEVPSTKIVDVDMSDIVDMSRDNSTDDDIADFSFSL